MTGRPGKQEKRRALLLASCAWVACAATDSYSQTSKSQRRIAIVLPFSEEVGRTYLDIFLATLRERGQIDGRDVVIEVRWANNVPERLPALARESARDMPDVILTATSAGVAACMNATSSIPIVFATAFSPVEQGFVASLRRPGGNVTGVVVYPDLTPKLVEVAREALPQARRLALLVHDTDPAHKFVLNSFEQTAKRFRFSPMIVRVAGINDFDGAFNEFAKSRIDVVIVPQLALFTGNAKRLGELGLNYRVPLVSGQPSITESGGLLSYGTGTEENYRRAAVLVDKILRGAKPSDLPVDQPERFELYVNLKTAKAVRVTLSRLVLLRADRVIE